MSEVGCYTTRKPVKNSSHAGRLPALERIIGRNIIGEYCLIYHYNTFADDERLF